MTKRIFAYVTLALSILLLTACSEEVLESANIVQSENSIQEDKNNLSDEGNKEQKDSEVTEDTIITLKVEQQLTNSGNSLLDAYLFNGFVNEDTLSFVTKNPYGSEITVYHPAIKGYDFDFKYFEDYHFEVVDFSREEGYVKLKITLK